MITEAASNAVLDVIVRIVGALWLAGSYFLFRSLRAEAMIDGMASTLSRMAEELEAGPDDADAPPPRDAAVEAWIDRDDRNRRRALAVQGALLAATGGAMVLAHGAAAWLVATLIAAQGVYFIWREHAARTAPTPRAAEAARPAASTVNAAWFSLAVGVLVWLAAARGVLA